MWHAAGGAVSIDGGSSVLGTGGGVALSGGPTASETGNGGELNLVSGGGIGGSGASGSATLLTATDSLPAPTRAALDAAGEVAATIIGGEAAVSAAVEAQVGDRVGDVERVFGATRYATSVVVADVVSCWQSVDRASIVRELAKRAAGGRVFVQVNATGEEQKGGCPPNEVADLVQQARESGLEVAGLMTVGVDGDDRATRAAFEQVRGLVDDLGLLEASMGMTADLALAVGSGSTMVRIGRALFGPRPHTRDTAMVVRD